MKIFALYTRVNLTQKPEWLDYFRKKFNQAYDIHVTFIQPRYIEDEKLDDLKSRVAEFFNQNKLVEKDRTIECKDLVYGKNSEGLYTFMLLAKKSENLLAFQKKLKEYLKDFGDYVDPTKEQYEINFQPHITIGCDVPENLLGEAKSYFQPNDSVDGIMNEMVLAIVKEQTVEESLNPENLTIFNL
jgi:2'-5' RNA ligase